MRKIAFLLLMFFQLLGCLTVNAQEKLTSGGRQRNMIVYAPKGLTANRPLLISMHGMNQDAGYQRGQANYEAVADTAKFVVVYPDGEGRSWDLGGMKDINFILDIIDAMVSRYKIDRNRVYLSGFSMGGMMTYYAMTKIADKIAAFAPVSGYNMGGPNAVSSRPIPIIHVHGTGDDVCTYGPVQSHIDAWVKRNKCKTTPIIVKKGTSGQGTLYRYTDGLEGVEVDHLQLPGKGHWHSNDAAYGMTNVEIWNFCSRYSLTPGPKIVSFTPEDNSFDMSVENHRSFTFNFDKAVDCSKVKGNLVKGAQTIRLSLAESGESKTLTFTVPETATINEGTYKLSITNVVSKDGGKGGEVEASYTYGVEEVGEELDIDTVFSQNWLSQQDVIGEGIPDGWKRVNTRSDGTDEKKQNEANTGGARMKYFVEGGEIEAGFYLSARDYDKVEFTYGSYTGKTLILRKGKYQVSFNSTYWNAGAQSSNNTFSMSLINASTKAVVYSESSLKPTGCLNENSNQKVTQCAHHVVECELPSTAKYLLQFSMSAGWNGIILGQPMITTCPSTADVYKGGFLRALAKAKAMSEKLQAIQDDKYESKIEQLNSVIQQYETLVSISPSEYSQATEALLDAMKPLNAVGINSVGSGSDDDTIYDLSGRKINGTPNRGVYIRGGKKIMKL